MRWTRRAARFANSNEMYVRWHAKKRNQKQQNNKSKTSALQSNWYFERQIVNSLHHLAHRQTILHISCSKQKSGWSQLDGGLSNATWYYSLDLWNHVHFSCSARQKIKKAIILRIKSVAAAPSVHQRALWNNNTLCRDSLINSRSHFHTAGVGGGIGRSGLPL